MRNCSAGERPVSRRLTRVGGLRQGHTFIKDGLPFRIRPLIWVSHIAGCVGAEERTEKWDGGHRLVDDGAVERRESCLRWLLSIRCVGDYVQRAGETWE
jgi:hypothetical protein